MSCAFPPELTEEELMAYLDGEADDRVISHVARCPGCACRARDLSRLQKSLTVSLYRLDCPTSLELGEWHLGTLPADRAAAVARHVADCPRCREEVAQLTGYLAHLSPDITANPIQRARVLVARLLGGLGSGAPQLAPVAVRGDAPAARRYEADDVQIVIDVAHASADPARRAVLGLVIGGEERLERVAAWQEGEQVSAAQIDALGNFYLECAPGRYDLVLTGAGLEVRIEGLDI